MSVTDKGFWSGTITLQIQPHRQGCQPMGKYDHSDQRYLDRDQSRLQPAKDRSVGSWLAGLER